MATEKDWKTRHDETPFRVSGRYVVFDPSFIAKADDFCFSGYFSVGGPSPKGVDVEIQCRVDQHGNLPAFVIRYIRVDPEKRKLGVFKHILEGVVKEFQHCAIVIEFVENVGLLKKLTEWGYLANGLQDICGNPTLFKVFALVNSAAQ